MRRIMFWSIWIFKYHRRRTSIEKDLHKCMCPPPPPIPMSLSDLLSPSALRIWVRFRPHLSLPGAECACGWHTSYFCEDKDVPQAGTPPALPGGGCTRGWDHTYFSQEEDMCGDGTTSSSPTSRMCMRLGPHHLVTYHTFFSHEKYVHDVRTTPNTLGRRMCQRLGPHLLLPGEVCAWGWDQTYNSQEEDVPEVRATSTSPRRGGCDRGRDHIYSYSPRRWLCLKLGPWLPLLGGGGCVWDRVHHLPLPGGGCAWGWPRAASTRAPPRRSSRHRPGERHRFRWAEPLACPAEKSFVLKEWIFH